MATGGEDSPKPNKDDPNRQLLSEKGFDCMEEIDMGGFGIVFKGICNSRAEKRYSISEVEASCATSGLHLTIEKTEQGSNYFKNQCLTGKRCAIKVMNAEDVTDTIHNEMRSLYSLSHPNCVDIYDAIYDSDNKLYYIVMEFMNGKDMNVFFSEFDGKNRCIDEQQAIEMIQQLAIGLQYMHSQGIYHGDLHSGNIMYNIAPTTGYVWKYLDFGLSGRYDMLEFQKDIQHLGTIYLIIIKLSNITDRVRQSLQNVAEQMENLWYQKMDEVLDALKQAFREGQSPHCLIS